MADSLVSYTGHPFVDVGAATLAIMAGKSHPAELLVEDLDRAADEMLQVYKTDEMKSYLSTLFPNAAYVNPTMGEDKTLAFVETYVRAYRGDANLGVPCVFTGAPAQVRIYRQHLPLMTGEGIFNFLPEGQPGLPVNGVALLCIQAMPLGTLRSQGRALLVHSSANHLTFDYAREFRKILRDNALRATLGKSGPSPKSMVLRQLTSIEADAAGEARRGQAEGVTVYHFTNYGTGANVEMYPLPAFMVSFLQKVQGLEAWKKLVSYYWQAGKKNEPGPVRNFLYERVFDLPDKAGEFVHQFLLGRPAWGGKPGPRAAWELVDLFLREVLGMEQSRIGVIREIARNLATYIADTAKDIRIFVHLLRCRSPRELRYHLLRANELSAKEGKGLVINFDQTLELFQLSEDIARPDWRLAWDLTLIRLMELLDERKLLSSDIVKQELEQEPEPEEPQPVGAASN